MLDLFTPNDNTEGDGEGEGEGTPVSGGGSRKVLTTERNLLLTNPVWNTVSRPWSAA